MTNCHHFGGFLDVFGKDWIDHLWSYVNFREILAYQKSRYFTMKLGGSSTLLVVMMNRCNLRPGKTTVGVMSYQERSPRATRVAVPMATRTSSKPGAPPALAQTLRRCLSSWSNGRSAWRLERRKWPLRRLLANGWMGCHGNIRNKMEMQISSDFRFVWQQEILGKIMIKHGCLFGSSAFLLGPFWMRNSTDLYCNLLPKKFALNLMQPVSNLDMAILRKNFPWDLRMRIVKEVLSDPVALNGNSADGTSSL